ncbi:putative RNA recognition motif domain, nucleotide-binding alpha-beta plait domain superfamily [Helianthus annuus]|nr:putative RNA recognition motif domain, nucleotide-binding alpha-beta plait domain superfamily [Helianthus annuus]
MERRPGDVPRQEANGHRRDGDSLEKKSVGDNQANRKRLERNITKFYVSNLPNGCTPWELSSFLAVIGEVSSTYIARKKDKRGNRFWFVSFRDMKDKVELERSLHNVKMGGNKLHVNIVRLALENAEHRESEAKDKNAPRQNGLDQRPPSVMSGRGQVWRGEFSYREILARGSGGVDRGGSSELQGSVIKVSSETSAFKDLQGRALVGRTTNLDSLININKHLNALQVPFTALHYLDGFSVLVCFGGLEEASFFLESQEDLKGWFSRLDIWNGQSLPFKRTTWLKITGVP